MTLERANRLKRLPPYLFAELDRMKTEAGKTGLDIISFGIGDPDLPTPPHIIEALDLEALSHAGVHEFLFAASPLRIRGGTGSPIRPVALAAR